MGIFFNKSYFDNKFLLDDKIDGDSFLSVDYSVINDDDYVVQGFVMIRDFFLISAYYRKNKRDKKKSRIYFFERRLGIYKGFVSLDNCAHVGGIAYDEDNDVLFVTGSFGAVNAYSFKSLLSVLNGNGNLIKFDSSNVDLSIDLDGNVSAATIYYYDNYLYVCTCSSIGRMAKYKIRYDDNKILVDKRFVYSNLPACIQGFVTFEKDDKNYYLVSQSYGRLRSIIKLFDYNFNFIGQKVIKYSGLEGIDIDCCGSIFGVFENSISCIKNIHISKLNHNIDSFLEKKYVFKGKEHQFFLDNRDKKL